MRITQRVVVAKRDQYGPFNDGRTIEYVEFIDGAGGGTMRATFAQGFEPAEGLFGIGALLDADLELHSTDKGLRLRLHGAKPSAAVKAA